MARNNGRWGRLRRVLGEDLSGSMVTYTGSDDRVPGDTPRYAAGANIENHPQVTDYIPRRFRTIGLILAIGCCVGIAAEVVAHYAAELSLITGVTAPELTASFSTQLVTWASAITLVAAAAYARIVFLLKRHRLDDVRGRYRVWRRASWLAVLLSANCVVAGHAVLARTVGHITNWHPLNDHVWWLAPTALVGIWVITRLILDAAESRTALVTFTLSAVCFGSAVALAAGWSPLGSELWSATLSRSLPLAGSLCALAGTLLTARYVVLDVQGLIAHDEPQKHAMPASTRAARNQAAESQAGSLKEDQESATEWIDGSEPGDDYSDDDRPLSKAERKRLRKQQGRYREA